MQRRALILVLTSVCRSARGSSDLPDPSRKVLAALSRRDYPAAEAELRSVYTRAVKSGADLDALVAANNLGMVSSLRKDASAADAWYAKAENICAKHPEWKGQLASVLRNRAALDARAERYAEAEKRLLQAADLAASAGAERQLAHILYQLGNVYVKQQRWNEAVGPLARSRSIRVRSAASDADYGKLLLTCVEVAEHVNKPAEAEKLWDEYTGWRNVARLRPDAELGNALRQRASQLRERGLNARAAEMEKTAAGMPH